ncbi:hypothetical protein D3C73_1515770 [compost metagenome]
MRGKATCIGPRLTYVVNKAPSPRRHRACTLWSPTARAYTLRAPSNLGAITRRRRSSSALYRLRQD